MTEEIKTILESLYDDYKLYKGTERITNDEWSLYAIDAYFFLQYLSSNHFKEILFMPEYEIEIASAIINIADLEYDLQLRKQLMVENVGISSESVKSHSVTYTTTKELVDEFEREMHKKKVDLAKKYLQNTGIFYRGL